MKPRHKIIIISVIIIIIAGCFLFGNRASRINRADITEIKTTVAGDTSIESASIGSQYTESSLFLSPIKQNQGQAAAGEVTGLIVPHHLLAVDLLAKAFSSAAAGKYQNVILLSPDHFQAGQSEISVTERNFSTVFGEVKSDIDISRQLKKLPFVSEGDFFYREHGLQAVLPFIKYYFPEAKVTALAFKPTTSKSELDQVIEILEKELPSDSLVVQSTDFSHYLAPAQAAKLDVISQEAIESANPENILKLKQPDNLDSVAALYVQARLQKDFFNSQPEILEHKNSQDYTAADVSSSTSYIAAAYVKPSEPKGAAEFIFVGDIMLSRYIGQAMERRQDYNFPFEKIKSFLAGADLVFGNLENPISGGGKSAGHLYSFRADSRATAGLKAAGFTVLSVANNHVFDYGLEAFSETLDNLRQAAIAYVGGGKNFKEAHQGASLEINGVKTIILAYTDLLPMSEAASGEQAGVAYLDQKQMVKDIEAAKEKSDLVIVSFHWGREYETKANGRQKNIAALAVAAGASLVVGHHPHVSQEIEKIQGVTVAYSLGNFIFDQNFSEETKTGLVLKVIVKDKKIESVNPYIINFNSNFQPWSAAVQE